MTADTATPRTSGGRPSKLTPATITAFTDAVAAGLPMSRAAVHLDVHERTWKNWKARGIADIEAGNTDTIHATFYAALNEALLAAERRAVFALVRATVGDEQVVERTTTSTRWLREQREDGTWHYRERTETTHVVEKRTVRDWRAALAWLERTQPETYARVTRQWVSGPGEEPIEVHTADDLRERLLADFAAMDLELAAANERETHLQAAGVLEPGQTEDP